MSTRKQTFYRTMVKPPCDRLAALVALVLTSPLFLLLITLLWITIGRPVFFRQVRPGYRGRPFTIFKFRTMSNRCGPDGELLGDEERTTRIGSILRTLSLDELPELFNVLRGEMSFVGPRPLMMQYLGRYSPEQARRHDVLPGITGWAQINGRNALSWEEKFKLDVWYVDHQSFTLDVSILLMTTWKVLRAEGISEPGFVSASEFMGSSHTMPAQGTLEAIRVHERRRWQEILDELPQYDFYHLPGYHDIAEDEETQEGVMFVYRERDNMAAWPLLLRDVTNVPGLEQAGIGLRDGTSVYGYPGPLCTSGALHEAGFCERFLAAVESACNDLGVVALFTRLNPVLQNATMLTERGTLELKGQTVYIDLKEEPEVQWLQFHRNCRYDIRKGRKDGIVVYRDETWAHVDEFVNLYGTAMVKLGARRDLIFGRPYFSRLREALGSRLHLFVAEKAGEVIAGSLFVHSGTIIQYHLSAKSDRVPDRSATRIIIDEARIWGNALGAHVLHLGGGVGAQQDGVYEFKRTFSSQQYNFYIWKHILMERVYEELVEARRRWLAAQGLELPATAFFPLFRAEPEVKRTSVGITTQ